MSGNTEVNDTSVAVQERIFAATLMVARRKGIAHITLDDIARHAQLSKGGLLYHFRTKNELFNAMLQKLLLAEEINDDTFVLSLIIAAAHLPDISNMIIKTLAEALDNRHLRDSILPAIAPS